MEMSNLHLKHYIAAESCLMCSHSYCCKGISVACKQNLCLERGLQATFSLIVFSAGSFHLEKKGVLANVEKHLISKVFLKNDMMRPFKSLS